MTAAHWGTQNCEESHQTEDGSLPAWLAMVSAEAAKRYRWAKGAAATAAMEANAWVREEFGEGMMKDFHLALYKF